MEDYIKQWCVDSKIFCQYVPIRSEESIKYVYDVLHGNIEREPNDMVEMLYVGDYHAMNGNEELMEKYHVKASEYGWPTGYTNLAWYYGLKKNESKQKYWSAYATNVQKKLAQ